MSDATVEPPLDSEAVEIAAAAVAESAPDTGLLIRGGVTRIIGFLSMIGLSVAYTAVLTRHLKTVGFGKYTTVISVATMVATVTDQGMANHATRDYASLTGVERSRMMSEIFGLRLVLTLLGTALTVVFAIAAGYDTALTLGMIAANLATLPLIWLHTMSLPLLNELRLSVVAMLEVARQAIWTVGLIVLCLLGAMQLPLLAMLLAANLAMIAPTWLLTHRLDTIRVSLNPRAWPPLLGETAMFSLATAVGTIYLYMTQIVTSLVASGHQNGLFSASFRIYIVTAGIPGLVGSSALPVLARAARDNHDQLTYVVKRFLEVSAAAGIGIALVMAAGSHFVILLLAGHKFRDASGVLEVQSFAMIATFVTAPCSYGLVSLRMYGRLLSANAVALAVTLAATLVLAHSDGARGAAIATILGETTVSLLMFIALLRHNRSFAPHLGLMGKLALATVLATPLALYTGIPSLPRAIATGCVYLLVVLLTRALPDEVMQMLPLPGGRPRSA